MADAFHFKLGQNTKYEAVVHLTELDGDWYGHIMFRDECFTPKYMRNSVLRFKWYLPPIASRDLAEQRAHNYYKWVVEIFDGLQRGSL